MSDVEKTEVQPHKSPLLRNVSTDVDNENTLLMETETTTPIGSSGTSKTDSIQIDDDISSELDSIEFDLEIIEEGLAKIVSGLEAREELKDLYEIKSKYKKIVGTKVGLFK